LLSLVVRQEKAREAPLPFASRRFCQRQIIVGDMTLRPKGQRRREETPLNRSNRKAETLGSAA
jgi:hypothetical protein